VCAGPTKTRTSDPIVAPSPSLFVWWFSGSCQILRPDLFNIEFCRALSHRLEHLFEWRRFALNSTQRVDARHHERAQVRADKTTFFQLLYRCRDFLLKVEHHRGPFRVMLDGGAEWFIGKALQSPED
jgi:hypothetical protein